MARMIMLTGSAINIAVAWTGMPLMVERAREKRELLQLGPSVATESLSGFHTGRPPHSGSPRCVRGNGCVCRRSLGRVSWFEFTQLRLRL